MQGSLEARADLMCLIVHRQIRASNMYFRKSSVERQDRQNRPRSRKGRFHPSRPARLSKDYLLDRMAYTRATSIASTTTTTTTTQTLQLFGGGPQGPAPIRIHRPPSCSRTFLMCHIRVQVIGLLWLYSGPAVPLALNVGSRAEAGCL